jgi:ribosomal protein S18 acetylase RimI-like enzyme
MYAMPQRPHEIPRISAMALVNRRRSNRSPLLGGLLNRLTRVGIRIHPFLVVREGDATAGTTVSSDPRLTCGFIDADDIAELVRVEPGVDAAKCGDRLRRGLLCYAVKDERRIVAKMWCDLEAFNFPPNYQRLENHEAYLFGAYTDPSYRGQNLAPMMRLNCYAALRAIGRDSFLSYTDYFNVAARRFKQKLGAVEESLRVHVIVFGRFSRSFTLRRYTNGA